MIMRTEKKETVDFNFTSCERIAFAEVEHILFAIQNYYEDTDKKTLTSLSTGEVIEIAEIARVRGVLSGLMESLIFEVE